MRVEEPKKQYGTYAYMPCGPDDPMDKKMELVQLGVNRCIDTIRKTDMKINLNTLKIWVNEDLDFGGDDPDWYADEKEDYQPSGPVWRIIVAIKAEGA